MNCSSLRASQTDNSVGHAPSVGFLVGNGLRCWTRAAEAIVLGEIVANLVPADIVRHPDMPVRPQLRRSVETADADVDFVRIVRILVEQGRAASPAEASGDAGDGFETGWFAGKEAEVVPPETRNRRNNASTGLPAAFTVTIFDHHRRAGKMVPDRAAPAAAVMVFVIAHIRTCTCLLAPVR